MTKLVEKLETERERGEKENKKFQKFKPNSDKKNEMSNYLPTPKNQKQ